MMFLNEETESRAGLQSETSKHKLNQIHIELNVSSQTVTLCAQRMRSVSVMLTQQLWSTDCFLMSCWIKTLQVAIKNHEADQKNQ